MTKVKLFVQVIDRANISESVASLEKQINEWKGKFNYQQVETPVHRMASIGGDGVAISVLVEYSESQ
ncbi:MAG TPA: hypothetical protein VD928_00875 [Candidatus Paceibacterota bacterium]|nr:hypothetical protein [Candidatus Paceibacterota bacterium]